MSAFYVVYPQNQEIADILNAIRLIAEEGQRSKIHITVRGPYQRKLNPIDLDRYSKIIAGEKLMIIGVSAFLEKNQNTIFYKCAPNDKLRSIWNKTSYSGFNPHVTIYDGTNRDFASALLHVLREGFKPFPFAINSLEWLEPKNKSKLDLYHLRADFDYTLFEKMLNEKLTLNEIVALTSKERLILIQRLCNIIYK